MLRQSVFFVTTEIPRHGVGTLARALARSRARGEGAGHLGRLCLLGSLASLSSDDSKEFRGSSRGRPGKGLESPNDPRIATGPCPSPSQFVLYV